MHNCTKWTTPVHKYSYKCFDLGVLHKIDRSFELTRLNVQILNIRQYSVLIIKYIILYRSDFLSSGSNINPECLFIWLLLRRSVVRSALGRIRAVIESPDPPWEVEKKLIWKPRQKFGLAKKPPEWICWGQEELLSRGYSHSALQNCLEISTDPVHALEKHRVSSLAFRKCESVCKVKDLYIVCCVRVLKSAQCSLVGSEHLAQCSGLGLEPV